MSFDPTYAADAIWVGVSFIALGVAFQYLFLPTCVDGLRDRLFGIRRELFMMVVSGEVSADDPAYVSLRRSLNAIIRVAERVTFVRGYLAPAVALLIRRGRGGREQIKEKHDAAFARVENVEVRQALLKLHEKLAHAVAIHVLVSSPIAWFVTLVAAPIVLIVAVIAGTLGTLKSSVVSEVSERVECEAQLLTAA